MLSRALSPAGRGRCGRRASGAVRENDAAAVPEVVPLTAGVGGEVKERLRVVRAQLRQPQAEPPRLFTRMSTPPTRRGDEHVAAARRRAIAAPAPFVPPLTNARRL